MAKNKEQVYETEAARNREEPGMTLFTVELPEN